MSRNVKTIISGLHIALIAGILVAILRTVQVPRFWCGTVIIPLIWFYTAATGWQPSAIRSTIMMTIIIAGWSFKTTEQFDQLARRRRVHHSALRPTAIVSGEFSIVILRRTEHRAVYAAVGKAA
ncbi:MAG: ComEC/Rec2 family competence protein [Limisphaerales bacterium]